MTPEAAEILKAAVNPDSGGQILYIKPVSVRVMTTFRSAGPSDT